MRKVNFKRIREIGRLSDHLGAPELNLISWNGRKKYDIRRWSDDGTQPLKGITVGTDELEDLLDLLREAVEYKKSVTPKYVISCGKAKARIYVDFGSFGYSGEMEKQVTYTDWGHGSKYDIRPWAENFSACGKGIALGEDECRRLIELIAKELGIEEAYGISFEDFVVRSNIFRCNKNHELETIQALISVLKYDGEISNETVSAGYCKHCNCYFILESDYIRLRNRGLPLCRQITEKAYRENGDSIFDGESLNPQSVLNQIGYNVNATEDLSSTQRQKILSFAVETGLYTVSGICSFLDWLIDKSSRVTNRDMRDAIRKWKEDRDYITKYKIGTRPMKGVKSLKGRSVR